MRKRKRKIEFSKYIVFIVLGLNVVFTAAVFILSALDKIIPDALIISWFAFTGTELVALAKIKIKEKEVE